MLPLKTTRKIVVSFPYCQVLSVLTASRWYSYLLCENIAIKINLLCAVQKNNYDALKFFFFFTLHNIYTTILVTALIQCVMELCEGTHTSK